MNRKIFFDAVRVSLFKGSLTVEQVQGMAALLTECVSYPLALDHAAYVLANVRRETGGHMTGIKETVMPSHTDKNPSDAEVIRRLDKAFADGRLEWVRTPYWRDGGFGRGPIQLSHWSNYVKFAKRLGVPLRDKPDLALDLTIGARIAVVGMAEGLFTGKKLGDFVFPGDVGKAPRLNPRRIVNGADGSDSTVAADYRAFQAALRKAGYDGKPVPIEPKSTLPKPHYTKPDLGIIPPPPDVPKPKPTEPRKSLLQRFLAALKGS